MDETKEMINPRVPFFDALSDRWDGLEDAATRAARLDAGLAALGLTPDERVLDVGCGTGNLTLALAGRLSARGRVLAIDLSERMLARARQKIDDPRIEFERADVRQIPRAAASFDRVICFSSWPHFDDPLAVIGELRRVLVPRGHLHVWHMTSRDRINAIHAGGPPSIRGDVLAPASEVAALLSSEGFEVFETFDDDCRYLISGRAPA